MINITKIFFFELIKKKAYKLLVETSLLQINVK